jgi:glyoxylase-like metal-dependent hydrolase (beta-lactamase superfamily II)
MSAFIRSVQAAKLHPQGLNSLLKNSLAASRVPVRLHAVFDWIGFSGAAKAAPFQYQEPLRVFQHTVKPLAWLWSQRRGGKPRPFKRIGPVFFALLVVGMQASAAQSQLMPGSMDVRWYAGAQDCAKNSAPALQVHPYNAETFILRENLCSTFEAPFMYLLIGTEKALLIDTGDIADPNQAPLQKTVAHLLSPDGSAKVPLLVVHTHRHLDHRAGDPQFAGLPDVQVVGYDIDSVRGYYKFSDWPNGEAQIDLGNRTVDVIPTPGHNETEVSFYDRNTGLFFTGDFLMPARLLVDDAGAYLASAKRAAEFVKDRPVSFVLGGHIEKDAQGETFPWQSQYHPQEHVLQMTKEDVLALPAAIASFNGFYTQSGQFVMMNSIHILIVLSVVVLSLVILLVWRVLRYVRRRRARKQRVG